jgi:hypothetical protein
MRTVYDEYNDEEIELSKEEMRMIQRIRAGPYELRYAAPCHAVLRHLCALALARSQSPATGSLPACVPTHLNGMGL